MVIFMSNTDGKIASGTGIGIASLAALAAMAAALYADTNLRCFRRQLARVRKAGYADKAVDSNGGHIACLEGPGNGPALLLIHGQDPRGFTRRLLEPTARAGL
jgi:hypothetical protein